MTYDDWKAANHDDLYEAGKTVCPTCEGGGGKRETDGWHTCPTCSGFGWVWETDGLHTPGRARRMT